MNKQELKDEILDYLKQNRKARIYEIRSAISDDPRGIIEGPFGKALDELRNNDKIQTRDRLDPIYTLGVEA